MAYAPTSPERRRSFVTEPGAVEGNPFDIYKEPEHNNDALQPNTFYDAGAFYSVKERPVALDQTSFMSRTATNTGTAFGNTGSLGNTGTNFTDPYGKNQVLQRDHGVEEMFYDPALFLPSIHDPQQAQAFTQYPVPNLGPSPSTLITSLGILFLSLS